MSVPNFRGGNYRGREDGFYKGLEMSTFTEMKEYPAVAGFLKNLPRKTMIIALNTDIGIIVAEGMHGLCCYHKSGKGGDIIKH